jgi:hypothetical protein
LSGKTNTASTNETGRIRTAAGLLPGSCDDDLASCETEDGEELGRSRGRRRKTTSGRGGVAGEEQREENLGRSSGRRRREAIGVGGASILLVRETLCGFYLAEDTVMGLNRPKRLGDEITTDKWPIPIRLNRPKRLKWTDDWAGQLNVKCSRFSSDFFGCLRVYEILVLSGFLVLPVSFYEHFLI